MHVGSLGSIVTVSDAVGVTGTSVLHANTLTLLNTMLLLTSGVVSIIGVHGVAMKVPTVTSTAFMVVSYLGVVFLGVQCCEYLHLYWCIYSCGYH